VPSTRTHAPIPSLTLFACASSAHTACQWCYGCGPTSRDPKRLVPDRWRILKNFIELRSAEDIDLVVKACAILNNMLLDYDRARGVRYPGMFEDYDSDEDPEGEDEELKLPQRAPPAFEREQEHFDLKEKLTQHLKYWRRKQASAT